MCACYDPETDGCVHVDIGKDCWCDLRPEDQINGDREPLIGVIKAARKAAAHDLSPGRVFQDMESIHTLNDLMELREKLSELDKLLEKQTNYLRNRDSINGTNV